MATHLDDLPEVDDADLGLRAGGRISSGQAIDLIGMMIAVKAYQREQGGLPDRLDDLVPRFLDRVPEDRFAGAPLRYSRARQVVYSVGEDFTDSGGGDDFDLHKTTEPALSLAF